MGQGGDEEGTGRRQGGQEQLRLFEMCENHKKTCEISNGAAQQLRKSKTSQKSSGYKEGTRRGQAGDKRGTRPAETI